jgi:hypothetical protein
MIRKRSNGDLVYRGVRGRDSAIFPQSYLFAKKTLRVIKKNQHRILQFISPMQSGKTNYVEALGQMILSDKSLKRTVHFISSLPYLENRNQDRNRLENSGVHIHNKFEVRKNINNYVMDNAIIIFDESHWGTQVGGILDQFVKAVLKNPTTTLIVISATPFAQLCSKSFAKHSHLIHQTTSEELKKYGYIGVNEIFRGKRLIDVGDNDRIIKDGELNPVFHKALVSFLEQKKRLVFIIRTRSNNENSEVKFALSKLFSKKKLHVEEHSQRQEFNFDQLNSQREHTVVCVNQLLRVGKTIPNKHTVYAIWDSGKTVETLSQGLVGRMCGYDSNKDFLVYANRSMLLSYLEFELGQIPTTNTKLSNRVSVSSKNSLANHIMDVTSFLPQLWVNAKTKPDAVEVLDWKRKIRKTLSRKLKAPESKIRIVTSLENKTTLRDLFLGKRRSYTGLYANKEWFTVVAKVSKDFDKFEVKAIDRREKESLFYHSTKPSDTFSSESLSKVGMLH